MASEGAVPSGSIAAVASAIRASMSTTAVTGTSASSKRSSRAERSPSPPSGSQSSTARWTSCANVIGSLLILALSGLFVGALARLALPGRDPMTLLQTMLVGIAGSLLAGILVRVLFPAGGAGILLSVLVTTRIVY